MLAKYKTTSAINLHNIENGGIIQVMQTLKDSQAWKKSGQTDRSQPKAIWFKSLK
jgi:hypothetical protein